MPTAVPSSPLGSVSLEDPAASSLAALRAATGTRHRQVEECLDVHTAFASLDAYRALLGRLYGFHAACQPVLEGAAADLPELFPLHDRAALLACDLRSIDVEPGDLELAPVSDDLATPEGALAAMYVIEASSLGGAVLARLARRRLTLGPDSGAAYFTADARMGERWRLVGRQVEEHTDTAGIDGLVTAASATFDQLQAWLRR